MGQCNLLIDRHVHKNGGTTLRHIFQSMPSQCRYYGGWRGLVHKTWLQILNDTVGDASGQARWACIEAHYPLMEDLLPQIRLARHMASCRAVLILRCAVPPAALALVRTRDYLRAVAKVSRPNRDVLLLLQVGRRRQAAAAAGPCVPLHREDTRAGDRRRPMPARGQFHAVGAEQPADQHPHRRGASHARQAGGPSERRPRIHTAQLARLAARSAAGEALCQHTFKHVSASLAGC